MRIRKAMGAGKKEEERGRGGECEAAGGQ